MSAIRRHERVDDSLITLLNAMTLDQLRTALHSLIPSNTPSVRSREEAYEEIEKSGRNVQEITKLLLDIEANSPMKHFFLAQFNGLFSIDMLNKMPQRIISPKGMIFTKRYVFVADDFHGSTFEHDIEVKEWETNKAGDSKQLVTRKLRHPIVLKFNVKNNYIMASYPGYSQGNALKREDRLSYETVIDQLLNALSSLLNITFNTIPFRNGISSLADAGSNRLNIISGDIESHAGRLKLDSAENNRSISEFFAKFIEPYSKNKNINIDDLQKAATEAIKNETANSFVAFWVKEQVCTRIQFWPIGTEFLFIWRDASKNLSVVNDIVLFLMSVLKYSTAEYQTLWEMISNTGAGKILTLGELAARCFIKNEELRKTLIKATDAGLLIPVFRLKTSQLITERQNLWTENPKELDGIFHTEAGEEIDGRHPSMIEVAFKRIGRQG